MTALSREGFPKVGRVEILSTKAPLLNINSDGDFGVCIPFGNIFISTQSNCEGRLVKWTFDP